MQTKYYKVYQHVITIVQSDCSEKWISSWIANLQILVHLGTSNWYIYKSQNVFLHENKHM